MKKIFLIVFLYFSLFINFVFAKPHLKDWWLPGWSGWDAWKWFLKSLINEFIAIVAVLAVFALIFSGIYYLISAWNDEKVGKAKKWIIWSLVWVFLSVLSWWIVNFLNNINISL